MAEVLIIAAYLASAAYAWTRVYRWLYREHRRDFADLEWGADDRAFGLLWGGVVALFWPAMVLAAGIAALARAGAATNWLKRFEN